MTHIDFGLDLACSVSTWRTRRCADAVPIYVVGVNRTEDKTTDTGVSDASCTTNCPAPLTKVVLEFFAAPKAVG